MKIPLTKEYLQDRFVDKKWSYLQIYKETGWSKATISKKITELNLRRRRNLRSINLINKKFGKVTVINIAPKRKKANYWICKCDCGKVFQASTGNLLADNYSTCGCERNLTGNLSRSWRGKGKLGRRYWSILMNGAEKRGILFDLTIDDAWEVFEKQNEKCALTGWQLTLEAASGQTASLDRIDSSKGYTKDNIQWLHKEVNLSKNTLKQERFLEMCFAITKNKSQ